MSLIVQVQIAVVAAILFLGTGAGFGQCVGCNDDSVICAAGSPWYQANETKLRVSTPDSSDYAQYTYVRPDGRSFSIDFETKAQGSSQTGRILLIGGRVMLTKGFSPSRGYEIDALDIPVLNYQLAVTLLSQAFPSGPGEFDGKRTVDLAEPKRSIKIATASAGGCFHGPWGLKGEMQRRDSKTIGFSFRFVYKGDDSQHSMLIDGEWKEAAKGLALDPSYEPGGLEPLYSRWCFNQAGGRNYSGLCRSKSADEA